MEFLSLRKLAPEYSLADSAIEVCNIREWEL